MKIIDLCEGYGAAGCLKRYYMENNIRDYTIHSFGLCLASGDIKNNRLEYLKDFYQDEKLSIDFIDRIKEEITPDVGVRIWSSKLNDDEYMLLFFLCKFLKDKCVNIRVIFSNEYSEFVTSIEAADYKEIEPLLKYERELSLEEVEEYANKWDELVSINSELRVLENGCVKCKRYEDYFEAILYLLKKRGSCTKSCLVGDCLVARLINDTGSLLYTYMIDKLIEEKKIKIVKEEEKSYLNVI
ncbi:MAG: DUF1835 domain-containing protein, partial [Bacilli bacterium]|nr:DUF1835 domain-containing protein [Bacilli bacterium]